MPKLTPYKSKKSFKTRLVIAISIVNLAVILAITYLTYRWNAQQLQEEIVSVENQLSFAKQSYNDSLMFFETARDSFFSSIVVGMFSDKLKRTFTPWKLSVEKAQDYEEKVATL